MEKSNKRLRCAILVPVAILVPILAYAGASEDGSFQFLHVIPTQADSDFDPNLPLVVSVTVDRPSRFVEAVAPEAIVATSDQEVVVRLIPYPAVSEKAHDMHLESTFLVDFESESVRALIATKPMEIRPTPTDLVGWTREAIEPAQDRLFDSASIILKTGRGDCTEYAVLFSALARSAGYPTRIAIGLVIAESEGEVQAFGHAWVEVRLDGIWELMDPTPIEGGSVIGYLPAGHLRDEGPGYGLDLARLQATTPTSVRVLGIEERASQ